MRERQFGHTAFKSARPESVFWNKDKGAALPVDEEGCYREGRRPGLTGEGTVCPVRRRWLRTSSDALVMIIHSEGWAKVELMQKTIEDI